MSYKYRERYEADIPQMNSQDSQQSTQNEFYKHNMKNIGDQVIQKKTQTYRLQKTDFERRKKLLKNDIVKYENLFDKLPQNNKMKFDHDDIDYLQNETQILGNRQNQLAYAIKVRQSLKDKAKKFKFSLKKTNPSQEIIKSSQKTGESTIKFNCYQKYQSQTQRKQSTQNLFHQLEQNIQSKENNSTKFNGSYNSNESKLNLFNTSFQQKPNTSEFGISYRNFSQETFQNYQTQKNKWNSISSKIQRLTKRNSGDLVWNQSSQFQEKEKLKYTLYFLNEEHKNLGTNEFWKNNLRIDQLPTIFQSNDVTNKLKKYKNNKNLKETKSLKVYKELKPLLLNQSQELNDSFFDQSLPTAKFLDLMDLKGGPYTNRLDHTYQQYLEEYIDINLGV